MKIESITSLASKSFDAHFINSLKQRWISTKSFCCIEKPKRQSLFLYLEGCTATYKDKDGHSVKGESGDLIYAPTGAEYNAYFSNPDVQSSYTISINCRLYDSLGEELILSDGVTAFKNLQNTDIPLLFREALQQSSQSAPLAGKILIMRIILSLYAHQEHGLPPPAISSALDYLSEHIEDNPTVEELARIAGISEVYFRRLFKEHLGLSPVEYRNRQRLLRARSLIEFGEISVQEISDSLGYSTVSHFIKEYKRFFGTTPLKHRYTLKRN